MNKIASTVSAVVLVAVFVTFSDVAFAPVLQTSKALAAETKKRHPGKRLYLRRTCLACHGRGGVRAIQDYPNIAGQPEKYLVRQIRDILSGKRVGGEDKAGAMRTQPMVGALVTADGKVRLSDEEIRQIASWLSQQPPAEPVPLEAALTEIQIRDARALYKKKCRACHGKGALKPLKGYPVIAGQRKAYIIAQVHDVKDRIRRNGKIKTMYPMVRKLTDEQIDLLAS